VSYARYCSDSTVFVDPATDVSGVALGRLGAVLTCLALWARDSLHCQHSPQTHHHNNNQLSCDPCESAFLTDKNLHHVIVHAQPAGLRYFVPSDVLTTRAV